MPRDFVVAGEAASVSRTIHNPDGVVDSTQYGYNQAIETDDHLYVSGQPGWDDAEEVAEGIEAQTHQALDNVEAVLSAAGCEIEDVAKVTCYLVDPHANLESFLSVWYEHLPEPRPCNTIVGVPALALPEFQVELDAEVPLAG
jgi:2-iminobutanoate/2-iminopropanoate deaminase